MAGEQKSYRVTWEINIDAESPEEAVSKALKIQQDTESTATFFGVTGYGAMEVCPTCGEVHRVAGGDADRHGESHSSDEEKDAQKTDH